MTSDTRTAIVTGAESGIGRAVALALAETGHDIGVSYLNERDLAEETADRIRAMGRRAVLASIDAGDAPACAEQLDALADELGRLDVFANVAGIGHRALFVDTTWDNWRRVLGVDLEGPFVLIQAAARRMIAQGHGGRIIAVSSVHAHQPVVGSIAYDVAKAGLDGLIRTAALELAEHGITVNSIAPGEIATRLTGNDGADVSTIVRDGIPFGRPGDPREVGAAAAFLASPGASYVTGVSLPVDGGMLLMGLTAGSDLTGDGWRRPIHME